jgi:hypothetical protein
MSRKTRLTPIKSETDAEPYWVWENRERWKAEHPNPGSPGPRRMESRAARKQDVAGQMLDELAPGGRP